MDGDMLGFTISMSMLAFVMMVLIWWLVLQRIVERYPTWFFKRHVQEVTKGKSHVVRKDDSIQIKRCLIELEVIPSYEKQVVKFYIKSHFNLLCSFRYNGNTKKIEAFECSNHFAKVVNEETFMPLLETYILHVIEQEYDKKSDRVLAMEKVKAQGELFQQGEDVRSSLENHYDSPEISRLVDRINTIASGLREKKELLEWEQQHQLTLLMSRRLPNLLEYADDPIHQKPIQKALEDVVHTMDEWLKSVEGNNQQSVEKELLLLKKITQS